MNPNPPLTPGTPPTAPPPLPPGAPQRPLVFPGQRGEPVFSDIAASIAVDIPNLKAIEGDEVRLRVHLVIRIPASDADRRVLRQTLLAGRSTLSAADVAAAVLPRLQAAATSLALASEQWCPPPVDAHAALQRAAATATYVLGLELDATPIRLEVDVPAYALRVSEQRRRQAREAEEQRRLESARRVGDVLQDLRDRSLPLSAVLTQVPPEEAQSLLLAALGQPQTAPGNVYCVAANSLIELRPSGSSTSSRWDTLVRPLPTDLGPLRSVFPTASPSELLIGARDGVMLVSASSITLYRDTPATTERRHLFAAHRQRGLVCWDHALPDAPIAAIRSPNPVVPPSPASRPPATSVRPPPLPGAPNTGPSTLQHTLTPLPGQPSLPGQYSAILPWSDDSVLIAGSALEQLRPDGSLTPLHPLSSRVLLLAESEGLVAAVCEDGTVRLFDALDLRPAGEVRLGEQLVSAGLLPWSGGTRLLCASAAGAVIACGITDPVVHRYTSAHRGMREVAGGVGIVAAVSPDRMRAILWDAWEPRRPTAEVHIGAVVRGRIADITVS